MRNIRHLTLLGCAFTFLYGWASASAKPNIVIVMADDMGYSDIGCYGGEIRTSNVDRLAENGLRFTQFYNAGRCCPTRASLLTGLYAHQTGIGHMTSENERQNFDLGYPGYRGYLNQSCVTIAEALKPAGYKTLMTGKWHIGTFEGMWPVDRGFDRYYGIIRGASNFFRPAPEKLLVHNRERIVPGEDYYTTDAFTSEAIKFVREAERDDSQPFFLYLAYTAPHWPLHAWPEDVQKYRRRYMIGWDRVREARLERMRAMGLIDDAWEMTVRDAVPWGTLSAAKKDEMDLRMAIYAAQIDRMDQNIGKFVDTLRDLGELDDTLFFFLADNGGCAEGGMLGRGPIEILMTKKGYSQSYGQAWANTSNTPFRKYKHWVHEGGIASPLVVHWPAGISAQGELRTQPTHLIDLMATALDVGEAGYPKEFGGNKILPLEGVSMMPAFEGRAIDREALYWEHEGNRAVRRGRWKLVAENRGPWELYDMDADRTETNDVMAIHPEIGREMIEMYTVWAMARDVLPGRPRRKPGYTPPERQYPETADYEPLATTP
ncbi:MAG: arylsulfatase [Bryobacterales bacterium]|nr:arylsulfatase [Bryobacterales bacterium]